MSVWASITFTPICTERLFAHIHDLRLWDEIEQFRQMHHFLKNDLFHLSIWPLANQPNTSISGCKQCDPTVSLHLLPIWRIFGVSDNHWSMARDVSRASANYDPITGWRIGAGHHPIDLNQSGESQNSLSRCICYSVGSLGRVTTLFAEAFLGDMLSPLAMNALPWNLLCSIIVSLIISLIILWTPATFTNYTMITTIITFATLLCKEQSFGGESIPSLDCKFLFDKIGDDLIGCGGHDGIFVHHILEEDFPPVISWDSPMEVEDPLLLTHLGDWHCSVNITISVSARWPSTEIVILNFLINPRCIVLGISAVL